MSEAELAALEQDVALARQKVAADLARLRSPSNLSDFKTDLAAEARLYGEEYMDKAKQGALTFVQQAAADLKEKAYANPAAAVAIGAGVAWKLFRSPPIAALLIGGGLVSLMRTSTANGAHGPYDRESPSGYVPGGVAGYGYEPDDGSAGFQRRMGETAQSVQYRAEDLATSAKDYATSTATAARDEAVSLATAARDQAASLATSVKDQAAGLAVSARDQAAALTGSVKDGAAGIAGSVRATASAWSDDARGVTRDAVSALSHGADSAQARLSDAAGDVAGRASRASRTVSRTAQDVSRSAVDLSYAARDALPAGRDAYLIGAAALAVGAAIGIALHRRSGDEAA
jgi:hypothetical protein